jgi:stage II sporulation protein D
MTLRRLQDAVFLLMVTAVVCPAQAPATRAPAFVNIGVFGLFHPREIILTASNGSALVLDAGSERIVLEPSSGVETARVMLSAGGISIVAGERSLRAKEVIVCGRQSQPVEFALAIPGKIRRRYRGILTIRLAESELLPVVKMPLEDAVASVVAAESVPGTPLEALKAQAVAARSYFVAAHGRHRGFDFCDTTHCQFLREVPAPDSAEAKATEATRGMVLTYKSQTFAAMYTRSCSGHTHTPADVKLPASLYPYFSVECTYCRRHPVKWQSRLSAHDAAQLHALDELSRLKLVRRLGWSVVPSNDFVMKPEDKYVRVDGKGQGHGIGLCQAGAKAMAEQGADFLRILAHYYPNTTIEKY